LRVNGQAIYSVGYLLEDGILNYIIIFVIIPMLIYFSRLIISFEEFFFIIYSFYFFLVFIACSMTLIIYLIAKYTFKQNLIRVNNPFRRMIYHPDLCRMLNVNNTHLEYSIEMLENLNLTDAQISIIKSNPIIDGKATFMIYDQGFVDFYSSVSNYTISLCKHIFWVISSIGFYFLYIIYNDSPSIVATLLPKSSFTLKNS
jgi:hypothetical protein